MTRIYITTVAVLVVAGLVLAGMFFLRTDSTVSPGGADNVVDFGIPDPSPGSLVTPQTLSAEAAVKAGFKKGLPGGDLTELGDVAIVKDYALLNWTNDPMGGEALLKYDSVTKTWGVIASTGGAFSVAALNKLGVPQRTVLALREQLGN